MKIFATIIVFMSLLFVSCSTLNIDSDEISLYKSGVKIFQKQTQNTKLQVELGQDKISGSNSPLIFFIAAENLDKENILFDIDNITLINNGEIIHPLDFKDLSRSMSLKEGLYSFGYYSKPIYQDDVRYFAPNIYAYPGSYFYYPYGVFLNYGYYNYSVGRAQVQRQIEDNGMKAIIFRNYLKKSTLTQKEASGGFILIPSGKIKSGNLELDIIIGKDSYKILFLITEK